MNQFYGAIKTYICRFRCLCIIRSQRSRCTIMYPVVHGSLVVGGMPKGAKRAELSAEQRSEIARLIAEIDRVQEETASAAEQLRGFECGNGGDPDAILVAGDSHRRC